MSYGNGADDIFVIKTDGEGNVEWERTWGGYDFEESEAIMETEDAYIIAGYTASFSIGNFDGLLLKMDKDGNFVWYKNFGGRGRDAFYGVVEEQGNYILAGLTTISDNPYKEAAWLVKCSDSYPAELNIKKPKNHLYIFDREIIPLHATIIIGGITVKADVNDNGNYVNNVGFYLCYLGHKYEFEPREIDYSPPYEWTWNEKVRGRYEIAVGAYYGNAGEVAADRVTVYILNKSAPSQSTL